MDVAADLLIRANRYRGMAARITDEETRMALLDLAAKYEALAREMQADDRFKKGPVEVTGPEWGLTRNLRHPWP